MNIVPIVRDGFARTEVERVVENTLKCDWCGGERAKGGAFRYRIAPDAGKPGAWSRPFCSIGCWRSYSF